MKKEITNKNDNKKELLFTNAKDIAFALCNTISETNDEKDRPLWLTKRFTENERETVNSLAENIAEVLSHPIKNRALIQTLFEFSDAYYFDGSILDL